MMSLLGEMSGLCRMGGMGAQLIVLLHVNGVKTATGMLWYPIMLAN